MIGRRDLVKQTSKTDKRGKRIFYILMFIVFFGFIAAQLLGNSEQSSGISRADYVYQGQILWEKPDGSSEPITIPGKYDVSLPCLSALLELFGEYPFLCSGCEKELLRLLQKMRQWCLLCNFRKLTENRT